MGNEHGMCGIGMRSKNTGKSSLFAQKLVGGQICKKPAWSPSAPSQTSKSPCLCKPAAAPLRAIKRFKDTLSRRNQWGLTPLHTACEQGHAHLVHILLHFGVSPDEVSWANQGRVTPLVMAASGGHADCVHLLLQFGADANLTDGWGNSALYKAACYNFVDCVRVLLEHGANPNATNKWGALPLQYAALQGHHEVTALLLEHGADVEMWGEDNEAQALTAAAMRGHTSCVRLLLRHGNPVNLAGSSNHENTPLEEMISVQAYNGDCLRLLLSHGAKVTCQAIALLHTGAVSLLVSTKLYRITFLTTILRAVPSYKGYESELTALFTCVTQSDHTEDVQGFLVGLLLDLGVRLSSGMLEEIRTNTQTTLTEAVFSRLKTRALTAPRLSDLCRLQVRRMLDEPLNENINKLPIPGVVKECVKLLR